MLILPAAAPLAPYIIAALSSIAGFLGGLFGRRVPGNVKTALEGLRGQLVEGLQSVTRFAWSIARALGRLLQAVHALWVRVLEPLLTHIARIARRINQIVDRVLRPYLEALRRIREAIDLLYNVVFRPIVAVLESVRRILTIARVLRIPGARALDARILKLEQKILEPIRQLYGKVNETAGWLGVILDARAVLQQAVLLNSIYVHQAGVVDLLWWAQTPDPDPRELERLRKLATPDDQATIAANIRQFAIAGAGPYAERGRAAARAFRAANPL